MSPVFGHGRLRLYLLKLLDESPKHGYEIIQQLRERFAGLYAPSAGTVYPRLARLEAEGLVRHVLDGGRKVYHITDTGREELARRADELADLEAEIRNSANNLASEIREEVKESARHMREELQEAARDARRETRARGGRARDEKESEREQAQEGDEREHGWGHGDWRGWHPGAGRPPWGDWQQAWKQQWQREWQSQLQEEMGKLRDVFGLREMFGAGGAGQFEQLFSQLRETVQSAAEHKVDSEQMEAAREVLERAARDIRDIFRGTTKE